MVYSKNLKIIIIGFLVGFSVEAQSPSVANQPLLLNSKKFKNKVLNQKKLFLNALVKQARKLPYDFLRSCAGLLLPKSTYLYYLSNDTLVKLIKERANRTAYLPENSLGFKNTADDIACSVHRTYGICGGMTEATKKFGLVAFYDPDNLQGARIPSVEMNPDSWTKYYVNLIEKVMEGEPTVIPGFRNLRELSVHPKIMPELIKVIAKKWADETLTWSSIKLFLRYHKKMQLEELSRQIVMIESALGRGEMPRIVFGSAISKPGGGVDLHSVIIWKVEVNPNGGYKLWTREPNSLAEAVEVYEKDYILVSSEGEMFYPKWRNKHEVYAKEHKSQLAKDAGVLSQLYYVYEDNKRVVQMSEKLKIFYETNPNASKFK